MKTARAAARSVLGVALVATIGTGCADTESASAKDTLTIATANTADCIDPAQNLTANSSPFVRPLVDSLVYQDPTDGTLHPWLARSWSSNDTATEFTFVLRTDVSFSDGTPFDATAVKTTWDGIVALGAQAATANSLLSGYLESSVTGPDTVTVRFAGPKSSFVQATSTTALAPISPDAWQVSPQERCAGRFTGTGPFTLGAIEGKQRLSLVRRDDYGWGVSAWHDGPAALRQINFELVKEPGIQFDALVSGTVDAATGIPQRQLDALPEGDYTTTRIQSPGIVYTVTPNTTRGPLTDDAVRRALIAATDRDQLVSVALGGGAPSATSILAANTPDYLDLHDQLTFDQKRARQLLDDAGWRPGADGIRSKGDQRLALAVTYPSIDQVNGPLLELLQQQWSQVGVQLTLRGLPVAELSPTQDAGDYDLLVFNQGRGDPDVLRTVFGAGSKNRARIAADDPLNAALEQQAAQAQPQERTSTVSGIQRTIVDRGLANPLYETGSLIASNPAISDYSVDGSFHDTNWSA
ncbi:ABC transporter substrate-binding protein [Rhodococcus jostii]|uniref:ABC transporter substrate-binding protein n=1 Tax=Rhodococcus jostii TaxID=132919 RepID=A0ABU4CT96_RHOJO|nr:ABC transporter substrate-binding protein [Rhodococcus jostii]MDV6286801.1 ABC transporter substrate-binding protein [Rhodococcus jostii]